MVKNHSTRHINTRKSLKTSQQSTGHIRETGVFGWGESKSLKSQNSLEGPFGNAGFWVGNIGYTIVKLA